MKYNFLGTTITTYYTYVASYENEETLYVPAGSFQGQ